MNASRPDASPTTVTILRAAAAEGAYTWQIPSRSVQPSSPLTGSDALATLALNATAFLLSGIPVESLPNLGLIVGTTLGCLEADRTFDRSRRDAQARYASPAAFSRTLPSTLPAEIGLAFHLTGPTLVVSAGSHSAALALRRAAAWMRHQNLDLCLTGAFDWNSSSPESPESCRVALLLLAKTPGGIGELKVGAFSPIDLQSLHDDSMSRLIQGIKSRAEFTMGAGVQANIHSDS